MIGKKGTLNPRLTLGDVLLSCNKLKLINAKVKSVPKLKIDASSLRLPVENITINGIAEPHKIKE